MHNLLIATCVHLQNPAELPEQQKSNITALHHRLPGPDRRVQSALGLLYRLNTGLD